MDRFLIAMISAGFLATILAANYVTTEYGMVMVWPAPVLMATAGTYFAGLAFVLRDSVQDGLRKILTRSISRVEVSHEQVPSAELGVMRETKVRHFVTLEPPDWVVALAVMCLIVVGAGLSYLVADPFIALASGVAFLASETADLLIYTPLRRRGYVRAAVASNIVGALVDTVLFLWIAGFPVWESFAGQMVGKLLVTGVVILGVAAVRMRGGRRAVRV